MNALELHILTTIADAPGSYPDEFEHCRTTLSILAANGLLKPKVRSEGRVFDITDKGLCALEREIRAL